MDGFHDVHLGEGKFSFCRVKPFVFNVLTKFCSANWCKTNVSILTDEQGDLMNELQ